MRFRFGIIGAALLLTVSCAGKPAVRDYSSYVWPSAQEPKIALSEIIDYGHLYERLGMFEKFVGYDFDIPPLQRPYAVASSDQYLAFSDIRTGSVHVQNRKSGKLHTVSFVGEDRIHSPVDLAFSGEELFIADAGIKKILRYNTQTGNIAPVPMMVERPTSVALDDEHGIIAVADTADHSIILTDKQGKLMRKVTADMNYPIDIELDVAKQQMYVLDSMNFRVLVLGYDGTFVRQFGSLGRTPGQFSKPKSLSRDRFGRVYVTDADFDNFQIFSDTGELLFFIGERGEDPERFWMPARTAISGDRLYVTDIFNRRIKVFILYP